MKLALLLVCACCAFADEGAEAGFVASARAATAKYQDRAVAIAEGYRQIGSDFPAMGEHWIRIGLLFDGKFDAGEPEVLTYVVVAGQPRLLGVAYVLPLLAGESAPDWPVGREKWHDHFRTIEDETELPEHHAAGRGETPRMTMLHAWIWLANPAGMFAADNWAIPYYRLGIAAGGPESAAKALALVSGGAEYFADSVAASAALTGGERKRVDAVFSRARGAVEAAVREGSIDSAELSAIWAGVWRDIDSSVGRKARVAIQRAPVR